MPTATVPNASLRYELEGRGDPTVLIHGSLSSHRVWEPVRRRLAPVLTVLAYDRRGHGESRGETRTHPVRDDTADLAALLEALDLFPAHLIAHSYGGAVALRLAVDRPEMVRSICLHEPPFVGLLEEDPATAPEAERLGAEARAIESLVRAGQAPSAAARIFSALSTDETGGESLPTEARTEMLRDFDRWVEEANDPDAMHPDRRLWTDLLIPVLLTTGERSPPWLHRIAAVVAQSLPNVSVQELPGVGHVPQRSDPDRFIALVHGFLVERTVPST
jgi:pimeloyl-ACP methyl ester carboxylesterase